MNKRILVVDDEEDILELVKYNLEKNGYHVTCVTTGEQALESLKSRIPDAIVLDLMLPGQDGLDVCRKIKGRRDTSAVPIVMLTAKGEDADIVTGLELGADDYVTKPFSPRVLLARLRAVLRRGSTEKVGEKSIVSFGELTIDPGRHEVKVRGEPKLLTATEFSILHYLARRPGWVFTRDQIISAVKGEDYPVTERSVDVQIVSLRKKLGDSGNLIETVRGVGYRFRE
ncbi:MAG: response regulator transcription factor [Desulfomonilaceae bacterium]|nr:response regulator transcription factor [Desulfomonilaceae bacterium]